MGCANFKSYYLSGLAEKKARPRAYCLQSPRPGTPSTKSDILANNSKGSIDRVCDLPVHKISISFDIV